MGVGILKFAHCFRASCQSGIVPPGQGRCGGLGPAVAGLTRLKVTMNKREESEKGRFKCLRGFKLGFEHFDSVVGGVVCLDISLDEYLISKDQIGYNLSSWEFMLWDGDIVNNYDCLGISGIVPPWRGRCGRAKERTPSDSYSFFTILEAKWPLQEAIDRPQLGDYCV
uniref:Uncharacterized protein n=1 Tax=Solanum tuberosum TaxID=4113 RepID=M1DGU2_SOLTU